MDKYVKEFEVLGETVKIKDEEARQNVVLLDKNTTEKFADVDKALGKKVDELTELVFIGDSFSTGYQPNGSYLIETQRIPNLFAKYTGLNLHNYAVNGSGYTINENTFYTQALSAIGDTSYDHSLVKYCVVLGGINDVNFNSSANIGEASASVRAILYENFPNCKVLQFPNWGGVSFTTFNSWNVFGSIGYSVDNYPVYYYPYNALCLVGYPNYVNSDNIHPNSIGASIIAKSMVALINGSYYTHGRGSYIHPTAHDGWDTSNLTLYMSKDTINCFGFIKATKQITGDDLDVCDIPAPFTFPVPVFFLGIRTDVVSTLEQSIQVYVTPPITLTDNPTVGKINLGVDATKTIESGTLIGITFSIPRLPF